MYNIWFLMKKLDLIYSNPLCDLQSTKDGGTLWHIVECQLSVSTLAKVFWMAHLKQSVNLLFSTTLTAKMFTFLNENLFLWVKIFPKKVNDLDVKGKDSVFLWTVEIVKCFPISPNIIRKMQKFDKFFI